MGEPIILMIHLDKEPCILQLVTEQEYNKKYPFEEGEEGEDDPKVTKQIKKRGDLKQLDDYIG